MVSIPVNYFLKQASSGFAIKCLLKTWSFKNVMHANKVSAVFNTISARSRYLISVTCTVFFIKNGHSGVVQKWPINPTTHPNLPLKKCICNYSRSLLLFIGRFDARNPLRNASLHPHSASPPSSIADKYLMHLCKYQIIRLPLWIYIHNAFLQLAW